MTTPPPQPEQTEVSDSGRGPAPWDPMLLLLLTFFSGLIAGGVLLGMNCARLNKPQRLKWTVALTAMFGLSMNAVTAWLLSSVPEISGGDATTVAPWLVLACMRGSSLALTYCLAAWQIRTYRKPPTGSVPRERLARHATLATVLGTALDLALVAFVFQALL